MVELNIFALKYLHFADMLKLIKHKVLGVDLEKVVGKIKMHENFYFIRNSSLKIYSNLPYMNLNPVPHTSKLLLYQLELLHFVLVR